MTRRVMTAALAATACCAMAAAPPADAAKAELKDRIGMWGGTWAGNKLRSELRIDEATPHEVTGTFCGVRQGDGSVFFFDFDKVKAKAKAGSVELKRGKQTYWVTASKEGVELGYRRKNRKRSEMDLAQGAMQCIERIAPTMAPVEEKAAAANGGDWVGAWTAYDDRGRATEVRITSRSAQGTSGTVCYVRKDDSIAYFDFGPGERIEASTDGDHVQVERKPFKKKMTHGLTMGDGGYITYTEKVGNKPPRLTLELTRGSVDDGCLRRIRPRQS